MTQIIVQYLCLYQGCQTGAPWAGCVMCGTCPPELHKCKKCHECHDMSPDVIEFDTHGLYLYDYAFGKICLYWKRLITSYYINTTAT